MNNVAYAWLAEIAWNADGLVPAIAQEVGTNDVLMLAWMNREALERTLELGEAVYWSRSRAKLWRKGETSGHVQMVREVRLDCDADTILLKVEQAGGVACHTGRHSCLFKRLERSGGGYSWRAAEPVVSEPALQKSGSTKK